MQKKPDKLFLLIDRMTNPNVPSGSVQDKNTIAGKSISEVYKIYKKRLTSAKNKNRAR